MITIALTTIALVSLTACITLMFRKAFRRDAMDVDALHHRRIDIAAAVT